MNVFVYSVAKAKFSINSDFGKPYHHRFPVQIQVPHVSKESRVYDYPMPISPLQQPPCRG